MQLSLLLDSIKQYDTKQLFSVHVLYAVSTKEYQESYERLKGRFSGIHWIQEKRYKKPQLNFQFDFSYWHNWYWWMKDKHFRMNNSAFKSQLMKILSTNDKPFTMFLTDDSLFYREITIQETCLEYIRQQPEVYSFSFRHGINLIDGKYQTTEDHILWNIYENNPQSDWGYPFSVDGHVYDSHVMKTIIRKILLNNPNSMEGNIACYIDSKKMFSQTMASQQSCLVGFELNKVQTLTDNHHLDISQKELNQYYLENYALYILFDLSNVLYFRPEIKSVYIQKENIRKEIYKKTTNL
jgi:hypothetical protein